MAHISDILLFKQFHYNEYSYILTILNFKTMKKRLLINLHNLSQSELAKREKSLLKGGSEPIVGGSLPCVCVVGCSCLYEGEQEGPDDPYYGGSTKEDSSKANYAGYRVSGEKANNL